MIQRFEYCVDLFWKVLKVYLEEFEKVDVPTASPRGILRAAVKSKILTENEGEYFIEVVNHRNMTSHIYHQEIAEQIASTIPEAHKAILSVIKKIDQRLLINQS